MKLAGDVSRLDTVWIASVGGDDAEFFGELVGLFEEQCAVLTAALAPCEAYDRPALAALVHKTKGSAMAVGLHGLGDVLAALERLLKDEGESEETVGMACAEVSEGLQVALQVLRNHVEFNQ